MMPSLDQRRVPNRNAGLIRMGRANETERELDSRPKLCRALSLSLLFKALLKTVGTEGNKGNGERQKPEKGQSHRLSLKDTDEVIWRHPSCHLSHAARSQTSIWLCLCFLSSLLFKVLLKTVGTEGNKGNGERQNREGSEH